MDAYREELLKLTFNVLCLVPLDYKDFFQQ